MPGRRGRPTRLNAPRRHRAALATDPTPAARTVPGTRDHQSAHCTPARGYRPDRSASDRSTICPGRACPRAPSRPPSAAPPGA
eukprot:ctg_3151.g589